MTTDPTSEPRAPRQLQSTVQPTLTLAEEVMLLSLESPRRRSRRAVRIAGRAYPDGPRDYSAAVAALRERGMIGGNGWWARPVITDRTSLAASTNRLRAIIHRPATPAGRDAELLALAAIAGAMPITNRKDHLVARMRLASIGRLNPAPPAIRVLAEYLGASTPDEFAERLLRSKWDVSPFYEGSIQSDGGLGAAHFTTHHGS